MDVNLISISWLIKSLISWWFVQLETWAPAFFTSCSICLIPEQGNQIRCGCLFKQMYEAEKKTTLQHGCRKREISHCGAMLTQLVILNYSKHGLKMTQNRYWNMLQRLSETDKSLSLLMAVILLTCPTYTFEIPCAAGQTVAALTVKTVAGFQENAIGY